MSELLKINVNDKTEKKNGLTYLSWAWAWGEVLKIDPGARWHAVEYGNERGCALPCMFLPDGTAMVKVEVTIKGETKQCLLPVMDHKNRAIPNPNAFQINTAVMRCLAKAISMHGLGLYIYAGEDLPEGEPQEQPKPKDAGGVINAPRLAFEALPPDWQEYLRGVATDVINAFEQSGPSAARACIQAQNLEPDHLAGLWALLPSKVRAGIKKSTTTETTEKETA